jgi:5-methylcytosine-specific restriction endonuclease McrA
MTTYKCLHCGKETNTTHQKMNLYCSHRCSIDDRPRKTLERFMKGEVSDRDTIRKMLTETIGYSCDSCGIDNWQGQKLTLQVDHIDGDASNNKPNNLRLICPNCHSQTKTFGARNKGNGRKARGLPLK